jgi:hypothetical protein
MSSSSRMFVPFFAGVVVIQGLHVFEHIVQLIQVYVLDMADDDAFGLLGLAFHPNNTEEWLHLGFNGLFLLALYALLRPMWQLAGSRIPWWSLAVFAIAAVGLESWHVIEHIVIIGNVIEHKGCPCAGIGDRVLGVTDTQLHFVYNAIAYAATVTPFWFLMQHRGTDPPLKRTLEAANLAIPQASIGTS